MELFQRYLIEQRGNFVENKIRLLHAGRKDRIPATLKTLIENLETETKDFSDFTLQIGLDYGGKDEIVRSISRLIEKREQPTEENVRASLDHPQVPDIDLVIRTSGEQRTSNFFIWQSAYAEWWFTEKLFPELTQEDLAKAVEYYKQRKRRFGS